MSPAAGQCMVVEGEGEEQQRRDFFTRVLELPSLQHAISLYNHTKKEHQYVGAALKVAEAGVCVAASTALPLAGPLVESVGGWATLNQWACQGLDRIEEAAPLITKPTHELVNQTREAVLCKLAGAGTVVVVGSGDEAQQQRPYSHHPPPSPLSLTHALSTRASNMARVVAESKGGVMVSTAVHCVIDTAHAITDFYLPPDKTAELFLNHDRGCEQVVGMRMEGLMEKWRRRLKLRVCAHLQVTHDNPSVDPDDFVITTGHLVELSRRLVSEWYQEALQYPYLGRVVQGAGHLGTTVLDTAITTHSAFLSTVASIHQVIIASPVGPVVAAGVHGLRDSMGLVYGVSKSAGIGVMNGVSSGGVAAWGVVKDGVNVAYAAGRGSVGVVSSLAKDGMTALLALVQTGTHKVGGITNQTLKVSMVVTKNVRGNGISAVQAIIKTTKDIPRSVVTSCKQFGTIHIGQPIIVKTRSMTERVMMVRMMGMRIMSENVMIGMLRAKSVTEATVSSVLSVGYGALQTFSLTAAVHNLSRAFGSLSSGTHAPPQAVQTMLLKQLHGVPPASPHVHSQDQVDSSDPHVNSSDRVIHSREHVNCTSDHVNSLDRVSSYAGPKPSDDVIATDCIESSLLIPASDSQVQGSWVHDRRPSEVTATESDTETEAEVEGDSSDDEY